MHVGMCVYCMHVYMQWLLFAFTCSNTMANYLHHFHTAPSNTITTFAQRQPKNAQYSNPKPITSPSYSLPFLRPLPTAHCPLPTAHRPLPNYSLLCCVVTIPSSSISHLYTLLSVDTSSSADAGAVAANPLMMLYSYVISPTHHRQQQTQCIASPSSTQADKSRHPHLPFAFRIASLLCSTISSGVSFGQLMMTLRCGASPMATVANSATTSGIRAVRIVLQSSLRIRAGCCCVRISIAGSRDVQATYIVVGYHKG